MNDINIVYTIDGNQNRCDLKYRNKILRSWYYWPNSEKSLEKLGEYIDSAMKDIIENNEIEKINVLLG